MAERRVHRSWGERFFLEPIFFWIDLYGPDGRPSHHKVLSAFGFFFALGFEARWGQRMIAEGQELQWPFVWLVIATLAIPMGKDVFKGIFGIRIGGTPGGIRGSVTHSNGDDERV